MKRSLLLLLVLASFSLGAGCTTNTNNSNQNANTNTTISDAVTYAGQDGKNALELLQAAHTTDVTADGFVNAIDGRKPEGRQYWAFYVNNTLADKGAKDTITKASDTISWKLEAY